MMDSIFITNRSVDYLSSIRTLEPRWVQTTSWGRRGALTVATSWSSLCYSVVLL